MNPVPPSAMKELVPVPGELMCENFKNGLLVNQVFYDWFAFMYTEGGEFTEAYEAMLRGART